MKYHNSIMTPRQVLIERRTQNEWTSVILQKDISFSADFRIIMDCKTREIKYSGMN
jgi:hypothetical protein